MKISKTGYPKLTVFTCFIFLSLQLTGQQSEPLPTKEYQKAIKSLLGKKETRKALTFIEGDADQANKDLIRLTQIPAPPFKEEQRARFFDQLLVQYGIDTSWIDEAGNVIGLLKGSSDRYVALDAHLDTVFPEGTDVSIAQLGDTLYAPGIGDDTRGLAVVLGVLRAFKQNNITPSSNLYFIGTVGEEGLGDLSGVKHIFGQNGLAIDSWISVDGGGLGRITNKALGSLRYKIAFKGPGGHSWGNFGIVNPHHALGSATHYFSMEADKYTKEGPKTSYNIGRIGGGTSVNSVPFSSWMEVDMRSESPSRLDSLDKILKAAVSKALDEHNENKRSGEQLSVELKVIGSRPSGEHPDNLPIVQNALAALSFFGEEPVLSRGSTNSNIPISKGVPAITIGRGGAGGNAHSLNEWWLDAEGYKAVQFAFLIVQLESAQ